MKTRFFLDFILVTLVLHNVQAFLDDLGTYFVVGKTIPEARAKHPRMAGKFRKRTHLGFGPSQRKAFVIHGKMTALAGIDALLEIHDVEFEDLLHLQKILDAMPSVKGFHLSRVESTWDFTPDDAAAFQKEIVRYLHMKSARYTKRFGKSTRCTFYINGRASDAYMKTYILPKVPKNGVREVVRVELTLKRRPLRNMGLRKPSDFQGLSFKTLTASILWKEPKRIVLRRSLLNLHTEGHFLRDVNRQQRRRGMASVITDHRKVRECPPRCKHRGHSDPLECPLFAAMKYGKPPQERFCFIQDCKYSREMESFETDFTRPAEFGKPQRARMKRAFLAWKGEASPTRSRRRYQALFPGAAQAQGCTHRKPKERRSANRPRRRATGSIATPIFGPFGG